MDRFCETLGIARATYYRRQKPPAPKKPVSPENALPLNEQEKILAILHSEKFVDQAPYQIYNTLIDLGEYHCSVRTIYRLLEKHGETQDRRRQHNHRNAVKPELIATRPNEVWSWDITKLLSTKKWTYYHLYVIMDIYSRFVVGWMISEHESQDQARHLIHKTALRQGIQRGQLTIHSDNGPSMRSHSVAQLLEGLGILKTHNRPHTSNDNPFSESQFKTLKYCPEFPSRFSSLKDANLFCQRFFRWYNEHHYHSGLSFLTPYSVHSGMGSEILFHRHEVILRAYEENPRRFNRQCPRLKALPKAVYINPPKEEVNLSEVGGVVVY